MKIVTLFLTKHSILQDATQVSPDQLVWSTNALATASTVAHARPRTLPFIAGGFTVYYSDDMLGKIFTFTYLIFNFYKKKTSCAENYNGTRCHNFMAPYSNKQTETSTLRHVIYGFTLTLLVCLLVIGVYYSIQKGFWKQANVANFVSRFNFRNSHSGGGGGSPGHRGMQFIRTNFNFNKLDDEQSITQNELNNI